MFKIHSYALKQAAYIFFSALVLIVVFSSWGSAPRHLSLQQQAGAAAFKSAVSFHQLKLNGAQVSYQTKVAYTQVKLNNWHSANIFYTAYTTGEASRPVTFVFNGGPGSSSIWLHMGSFGPVRAVPGCAGYQNNPDTWLGFTDLVFIDPVGTGFSRPADGTNARRFYGYQADVESIALFIQNYLEANNRTNVPLFLAGESYGAARAVGLAAYLQDTAHINIAGLTLISPALNYKLVSFGNGNDEPYAYYLSAYAAAAQYHQRLNPELQGLSPAQLRTKVNAFAFASYRRFLAGDNNAAKTIDTLSAYTGIDSATLHRLNGRLTDVQFTHLLLAGAHQQTGTFDLRDTGTVTNADPSELSLRAVFPKAFQLYQQQMLHYENQLPYLATIATPDWNYGPTANAGYLNVVPALKSLLQKRPNLVVHVVGGDYDLATPAATVNAVLNELPAVQIVRHQYASGHMIYTDDASNAQWRKDSEAFYKKTLKQNI